MSELALGIAALLVWPFAADGISDSGLAAFWSIMFLLAVGQTCVWLGSDPPGKRDGDSR